MSYIFFQNEPKKAAIFDLDYTLIKPINSKFSKSDTDWEYYSDNVISTLKKYYNEGYEIVIVSNQKILKTEKLKELWKKKMSKIGKDLGFHFKAFCALKDDGFRKPRTLLWDNFLFYYDKSKSFYCGDAGGLPFRKINNEKIKKDFSDSDLKFALNIGIKFIHRDEIFLGQKSIKIKPLYPFKFKNIKRGEYPIFKIKKKTLVVNVGYPGSGKSYFTNNFIKSKFVYINRDILKSTNKCISLCKKAVYENHSIVIDNTNPSPKNRKIYIDIAKDANYNIVCLNFTTSYSLSMHNNIYRNFLNPKRAIVPKVAFNIYKSKFKNPSKREGFDEIKNIDFLLSKNVDVDLYSKYYF